MPLDFSGTGKTANNDYDVSGSMSLDAGGNASFSFTATVKAKPVDVAQAIKDAEAVDIPAAVAAAEAVEDAPVVVPAPEPPVISAPGEPI